MIGDAARRPDAEGERGSATAGRGHALRHGEEDRSLLRPVWQRSLRRPAWVLCLFWLLALGIMRAVGTLGDRPVRFALVAGFVIMGFLPFAMYSRTGRQRSGITRVDRPGWLLWGPLLGGAAALLLHVVGHGLFGTTPDNWYVTVRASFPADPRMVELPRLVQFVVVTLPAVIFSPLGEEFFFRGMMQAALRQRFGGRIATGATAVAFGLVHLLHHGLRVGESGPEVLLLSGALWVAAMAGLSLLLAQVRARSESIWPAVAAHVAFNIGMNYSIFYLMP